MANSFHTTRRVEFGDTDMAGIVHFPRFFYYMEEAEHAFLRSLGLDVMMQDDEGMSSWPRVSAACDYQRPAKLNDVLQIEVRIAKVGRSSITYEFLFTLEEVEIARGKIVAVYCRILPGERPKAIPLPATLLQQVQAYHEPTAE